LFIPVLLWNRHVFAGLLVAFLAFYLSVELLERRGMRVPFLWRLTEQSKRPFEHGRLSKGALFLVLCGLVTPYLFGAQAAAVGLAQAFAGDVTSSLAGMKWGVRKLPWSPGKSWVGTSAFFFTALAVSLFFFPFPQAAALAAVGALAESIPWKEADNLTVPLAVGLAARLMA
jgi:dolichol kinase